MCPSRKQGKEWWRGLKVVVIWLLIVPSRTILTWRRKGKIKKWSMENPFVSKWKPKGRPVSNANPCVTSIPKVWHMVYQHLWQAMDVCISFCTLFALPCLIEDSLYLLTDTSLCLRPFGCKNLLSNHKKWKNPGVFWLKEVTLLINQVPTTGFHFFVI